MKLDKKIDQHLIMIINEMLDKKIIENDKYIRITFYELRIKYNLNEEQTDRILELIKNKLERMNYQVFFTGAKFEYQNCKRTVQINELVIAIKESE